MTGQEDWFLLEKQIKKQRFYAIAAVIIAIVSMAALFYRFWGAEERQEGAGQTKMTLTKRDITDSVSVTGVLESVKTRTVSASVSNVVVKKVYVREGDEVKKGQKLMTFDETDLRMALFDRKENLAETKTQADVQLASANRKLEEAKENYAIKKKSYAVAERTAKSDYLSAKEAFQSAGDSLEQQRAGQTLNQAKRAYEQAKSERESGNRLNRSNLKSAKEQIAVTRNNNKMLVREAELKVREAKKAVEKCSVIAPVSGTVVMVGVEEGDQYQGADLFEISNCENLQVYAIVDEYAVSRIGKGQKVRVFTDAGGQDEWEGKISYVAKTKGISSGTSAANNSAAGTNGLSSASGYALRIRLKGNNKKLRIGMTARCSIIIEEAADVFAVPYDAVHRNKNGDTVLYVEDGKGMRKEIVVTKGMESDYYVEVIGEGLQEGLQVMLPSDTDDETAARWMTG